MGVRKPSPVQLNLHQLGGTTPATDSPFVWLTVPAIALPVHAGLHCRGRLICLLPRPTRTWLISASPWWSSTPQWIFYGLTYQVKSIQYIFILSTAFFKRAITLACKFFNAGQVISLSCWLTYTGLHHGQIWRISRQLLESPWDSGAMMTRLSKWLPVHTKLWSSQIWFKHPGEEQSVSHKVLKF